jgi:hypothetical protein
LELALYVAVRVGCLVVEHLLTTDGGHSGTGLTRWRIHDVAMTCYSSGKGHEGKCCGDDKVHAYCWVMMPMPIEGKMWEVLLRQRMSVEKSVCSECKVTDLEAEN